MKLNSEFDKFFKQCQKYTLKEGIGSTVGRAVGTEVGSLIPIPGTALAGGAIGSMAGSAADALIPGGDSEEEESDEHEITLDKECAKKILKALSIVLNDEYSEDGEGIWDTIKTGVGAAGGAALGGALGGLAGPVGKVAGAVLGGGMGAKYTGGK